MTNWKKLSKRSLSFLLALVMCLGMLNLSAFAAEEEHAHNEDGWVCTQAEPTEALTCEAEVHTHNEDCYTPGESVLDCEETEHTHGDSCYDEEGNLTCTEAEHTHDSGCYTESEPVLTCETEEHEHTDACYTVTEGAWTCIAPVVEDEEPAEETVPEEVQAFLDAVAALPSVSEITADNAEAVGAQVNAALELYEAIENETEEVSEALETVYAVYAAVLTAEEIEDSSTFADGVIKSAFVDAKNLDQGYTCNGTVQLNGEPVTDSGTPNVWPTGNWGGSVNVTGYNWVHITNSNPKVATVSYKTEGGKLSITFTPGTAAGTTKISVGVDAKYPHYSLGTWNMELNFDYTVTNNGGGGGTTEPGNKPAKPTVDDVPTANQDGYVYVKCVTYPNSNPRYNNTRTHAGYMSLRNSVDGWSFGEVYANDGRFGKDAPASEYPWLCDLTLDKDWYLDRWNTNYARNEGTHYLSNDEPVSMTFVSDGDEWYYFTEDVPLVVWTTHEEPTVTYTVKYTDGVEDEEVFVNQVNSGLAAGDTTPAFEAASKGTETVNSTVQPKRDGYTFMGWAPAINPVVSADDADEDGVITYTATWQKLKDLTVTKTPSEEYPIVDEEFYYTIEVANGNSTAVTVTVTDVLNAKLDFVSASDGGTYDPTTRTVTWNNMNVPANGTKTLVVWVTANTADEIYNEARAVWTGGSTSGNTTVEAKDPENPPPTDEKPDAPDHQKVRDLVGAAVKVVCDTPGSGHEANQTFGYTLLSNGTDNRHRVTIGEVKETNGVYTCDVTFLAQKFCDAYNGTNSAGAVVHKLAETQGNVTLTFTWNATTKTWERPADVTEVVIHTVCGTETPPETGKTPKIEVKKSNTGFQVDPQTGNATVDYIVKITNVSGFDIYGLRLTDTMTPTVTPSNANMTYTFKDWKVDGVAITPTSGEPADLEHVLQLLARETKFVDEQIVTLTYTVEIENNGDGQVAVKLDNTAKGASWSKAPTSSETPAPRGGVLVKILSLLDDEPDVTGSASSSATTDPDAPDVTDSDSSTAGGTTGGDGSSTEGTLPAKYTVTYQWDLPAEADETLPTEPKRPAGATVTVDTVYTSGNTTIVDGKTYTFSGWSTTDATVENGQFTMPAKNVIITGTWTAQNNPAPETPEITKEDLQQVGVVVRCVNDSEHDSGTDWWQLGGELKDGVVTAWYDTWRTIGEVENIDGTYQCIVTLHAEPWANLRINGATLQATGIKHVFDEGTTGGKDVQVKFTYEDGAWKADTDMVTVWIKEMVTVTYKDADGNVIGEPETEDKGTEFTIKDAPEAPEGKEFDYWSGDDGKQYHPGDTVTPETDLTLTVVWKDKEPVTPPETEKITATWLPGYGDNTPIQSKEYDKGTTTVPDADYPAENPTRDGYTFTGWGAPVIDPETGNITITAQWSQNPGTEPNPPAPPSSSDDDDDDYTPPSRDDDSSTTPAIPPEVDIEDEEPPLTDLPEEDPPLAERPEEPEELTEILDEEPPLADVPETGDNSGLWLLLGGLSAAGVAGVLLTGKKREDDVL